MRKAVVGERDRGWGGGVELGEGGGGDGGGGNGSGAEGGGRLST